MTNLVHIMAIEHAKQIRISVFNAESVSPTSALKKLGYVNVVSSTMIAQSTVDVRQNPQMSITKKFQLLESLDIGSSAHLYASVGVLNAQVSTYNIRGVIAASLPTHTPLALGLNISD